MSLLAQQGRVFCVCIVDECLKAFVLNFSSGIPLHYLPAFYTMISIVFSFLNMIECNIGNIFL